RTTKWARWPMRSCVSHRPAAPTRTDRHLIRQTGARLLMPPIEFGPIEYLAGVWVISAVLLILGALAYQSNVGVGGTVAWIISVVYGSAGGFLALPLTIATKLEGYLFVLLLVAFAVSIPVIHRIMPTIPQDFQTSGSTSSQ